MRKISFAIGEYYHIYNRGVDKRNIFLNKHDYNRFVTLLYVANGSNPVDISKHFSEGRDFADLMSIERGEQLVYIGAYCLMPNHFHLLIREKQENGISQFMKKISVAYSMHFNTKHKRTGALFEGRFKAKYVDSDEYLKYLFSYIHLNPIKIIDPKWKENGITDKAEAKEYLASYRYSSYLDYLNKERKEKHILNTDNFPEYFENLKDFEAAVDEWLLFKDT